MSFQNANLPIQTFINNYGNTTESWPVLDYVRAVSDANNNVTLNPNSFLFSGGKLRQAILNYFPILCDVDGSCSANVCDDGVALEPKQTLFDIDRCTASMVFSVTKDSTRLIDNNAWDFSGVARAIINSAMPQLRKNLALDWTTYLTQLAGLHPDGNYTHRITVTDPTTGIVNVIGWNDMKREYFDNGLMEPYVLGGAEVYNWLSMREIGGLNAQGQYVNRMPSLNAWYDKGMLETVLDDAANGGWILSIDPQVFKYVYYLENAGQYATGAPAATPEALNQLFQRGTETLLNGVLIDPVTGIPWDFDLYYSPCGKKWNFQLKHRWNFFVMPNVACLPQGSNGIWLSRTCPAKIADCPTGDNPSPAIALETYDWNPGSIFPRSIYASTIAGTDTNLVSQPRVVTTRAELAAYMSDASQITFTVSGNNIQYAGHTVITASLITNSGTVNSSFA